MPTKTTTQDFQNIALTRLNDSPGRSAIPVEPNAPGLQDHPFSIDRTIALLGAENGFLPLDSPQQEDVDCEFEQFIDSLNPAEDSTLPTACADLGPGEFASDPMESHDSTSPAPGLRSSPSTISTDSNQLFQAVPEWLHETIMRLGSDPGLVTVCMLSAISATAGKRYVLTDGDRLTYANSFMICACPASFGKSVVNEQIFAPLRQIEADRRTYLKDEVDPVLRCMLHKVRLARAIITKRLDKDCGTNAEMIAELLTCLDLQRDEIIDERTRQGIFLINDATNAGLKRDLSAASDNYVGMILSDAREFLERMSESHQRTATNYLCQTLLNCFSGDAVTISRASGVSHRLLDNPRMTLLALAQPDKLDRFFSQADNHQSGLCSRSLFFVFENGHTRPDNLPPELREQWAKHLVGIHQADDLGRSQADARRNERNVAIDRIMTPCPPTPENDPTHPADPTTQAPSAATTSSIPAVTDPLPIHVHPTPAALKRIHEIEALINASVVKMEDPRVIMMYNRSGEILRRQSLCRAMLRRDFIAKPQVLLEDVEAAESIVRVAARTFTELCSRADSIPSESAAVIRLREILQENGGFKLMKGLVHTGVSQAQARQIAAKRPGEFQITRYQSGKAGKPATIIRLTPTPQPQAKAPLQ